MDFHTYPVRRLSSPILTEITRSTFNRSVTQNKIQVKADNSSCFIDLKKFSGENSGTFHAKPIKYYPRG